VLDIDRLKTLTQVNTNLDLSDDRATELAEFFKVSKAEIIQQYHELNVYNSRKPEKPLFIDQDHKSVIASYLDPVFLMQSLTRLMLKYDRFDLAYKILLAMSRDRGSDNYMGITILDYGCGAADYALMFALQGARPVIADIAGGPVEFASFRMQRRSIDHNVIKVSAEIEYPSLPKVDIINATEVLEHVDDPIRLILRFAHALNPGGYFTFSDYPRKPKTIGGAHLRSAADRRSDALLLLNDLFTERWADPAVGYIYRVRDLR
jgi:2-polyprenyl-3-methyl-5-hydroxy-6-metoxy-1,4-benzoquinol methylase